MKNTVAELKKLLSSLPDDTPVEGSYEVGWVIQAMGGGSVEKTQKSPYHVKSLVLRTPCFLVRD